MTLKVKVIKVTLFSAALEDNGLSDPYVDVELRVSGS
jgi:ribosomal protein L10